MNAQKISKQYCISPCRDSREGTLFYIYKKKGTPGEAVIFLRPKQQSANRFGLENINLNPADGATMVVVSKSFRFLLREDN